jgi:hypothetical protein
MKKYRILWKSYDFNHGKIVKTEDFSDVQWKDYGARATIDETGQTYIIPYTSIYEIKIIEED